MTAVVGAAALLALAACSGNGGGDEEVDGLEQTTGMMENFEADEQFTATEPVNLSLLWTDWPDMPVKDSWQVFDEIEERTNVSIELTNVPFSDHVEKRSLLISSGDAPDVIPLVYTGEEQQFAATGAVLPLSDYAEYMPNFQKRVEEWDLGAMIDNLRQADGKYYMVPGLQEVSVPVFTLIIRKDVFDEVGAPVPETWDELRDGLEKIKEEYPDSKPLADGFEGGSMLNYAAHAFGTVAGWGFGDGTFFDEESGTFEYAATSDGYRDMLEYFNGLAEDGLLDTESFTATNDGMGTVTEKFAAEQVFAASGSNGTVQDFATALDATDAKGKYEPSRSPHPAARQDRSSSPATSGTGS
ncbi:extracellular solute-binding protein [Promicromonospora soli]